MHASPDPECDKGRLGKGSPRIAKSNQQNQNSKDACGGFFLSRDRTRHCLHCLEGDAMSRASAIARHCVCPSRHQPQAFACHALPLPSQASPVVRLLPPPRRTPGTRPNRLASIGNVRQIASTTEARMAEEPKDQEYDREELDD